MVIQSFGANFNKNTMNKESFNEIIKLANSKIILFSCILFAIILIIFPNTFYLIKIKLIAILIIFCQSIY